MDGVGEALVFALKTSLQLKTGGLVYRPVSGRGLSQGQSQHQESKSTQGACLGEKTPSASVVKKRRRLGEGVTQPGRRQIKHY